MHTYTPSKVTAKLFCRICCSEVQPKYSNVFLCDVGVQEDWPLVCTSTSCACWQRWQYTNTRLLLLCTRLNGNSRILEAGSHSVDKFLDILHGWECFVACYISMIQRWIKCVCINFTTNVHGFPGFLGMGVHVQAINTRPLSLLCAICHHANCVTSKIEGHCKVKKNGPPLLS